MKLYLVESDEYGAVIAAYSKESAIHWFLLKVGDQRADFEDQIECVHIGESLPDQTEGPICGWGQPDV